MGRSGKDRKGTNLGKLAILLLFLHIPLWGSCQERGQGRSGQGDYLELYLGNSPFSIEVVADRESRSLGLMYRSQLEPQGGMLFVFPVNQRLAFWMKDTTIPLSIAYIDENGVIGEIHDLVPLSTIPVISNGSYRYALELNRGAFARAGVAEGYRIDTGVILEFLQSRRIIPD